MQRASYSIPSEWIVYMKRKAPVDLKCWMQCPTLSILCSREIKHAPVPLALTSTSRESSLRHSHLKTSVLEVQCRWPSHRRGESPADPPPRRVQTSTPDLSPAPLSFLKWLKGALGPPPAPVSAHDSPVEGTWSWIPRPILRLARAAPIILCSCDIRQHLGFIWTWGSGFWAGFFLHTLGCAACVVVQLPLDGAILGRIIPRILCGRCWNGTLLQKMLHPAGCVVIFRLGLVRYSARCLRSCCTKDTAAALIRRIPVIHSHTLTNHRVLLQGPLRALQSDKNHNLIKTSNLQDLTNHLHKSIQISCI